MCTMDSLPIYCISFINTSGYPSCWAISPNILVWGLGLIAMILDWDMWDILKGPGMTCLDGPGLWLPWTIEHWPGPCCLTQGWWTIWWIVQVPGMSRRCLGVYIGCSWSILCGFVFLLFGMATMSGTIPYILPAYLGNSFTCVQYRMCYTCPGPVFWCEFNCDINLVIGLTKYGNFGNWYICICIQHQFSMRM